MTTRSWTYVTAEPVFELVGTCFHDGQCEQDNSFQGVLSWDFLYIESENSVYSCPLALKYVTWNHGGHNGTHPFEKWEWTQWVTQGMPQTISECRNLLWVVTTTSIKRLERFKAWMILSEFLYVLTLFAPSQCNYTMSWAMENLSRMHRPGAWLQFESVPLDPNAFEMSSGPPGIYNVRMPTPDVMLGLFINPWLSSFFIMDTQKITRHGAGVMSHDNGQGSWIMGCGNGQNQESWIMAMGRWSRANYGNAIKSDGSNIKDGDDKVRRWPWY